MNSCEAREIARETGAQIIQHPHLGRPWKCSTMWLPIKPAPPVTKFSYQLLTIIFVRHVH